MDNHEINQGRRRFLVLATAGAGGLAAAGVAAPFVASWFPSEKAKAAGAPIEIDVSKIESGQMLTAEWQGKPIWVVNRTDQQLKDLKGLSGVLTDPNSEVNHQPEDCKNETRSIKPNVLASAPTWAVRRPTARTSLRQIWGQSGKAASSARATAPNSTLPDAFTPARPPRPIWLFLPINT